MIFIFILANIFVQASASFVFFHWTVFFAIHASISRQGEKGEASIRI